MNDETFINDRPLWLNRYISQCGNCVLYNDFNATCKAFPDGIPIDMLEGKITHNKPIKGQTGDFIFSPKKVKQ